MPDVPPTSLREALYDVIEAQATEDFDSHVSKYEHCRNVADAVLRVTERDKATAVAKAYDSGFRAQGGSDA